MEDQGLSLELPSLRCPWMSKWRCEVGGEISKSGLGGRGAGRGGGCGEPSVSVSGAWNP